jgi:hypothetical protein
MRRKSSPSGKYSVPGAVKVCPNEAHMNDSEKIPLLCSDCFADDGLKLEAQNLGLQSETPCPNCYSRSGSKLTRASLIELANRFFVHGTWARSEYGGASVVQFNEARYGEREVKFPTPLSEDANLIEDTVKIGFFYYAPATWRLGEIEPLTVLRDENSRPSKADEIVEQFPRHILRKSEPFFRLRKGI